jgi:hypothetical protein
MPHCNTPLVPSAWNGDYDLTLIYVGSSTVDKHWVLLKWQLEATCSLHNHANDAGKHKSFPV